MGDVVLEMRNIVKDFPGVRALNSVNFEARAGEVLALVGENGAGKSTLMKILFGIEQPSAGKLYLRGEERQFHNSLEAIDAGIGMVHQHFMLIPSFTVAQSIVLGMEPRKGKLFLNKKAAIAKTQAIAEKYNFDIDVTKRVSELSVGAKQKVEILKTLYRNAEIIILDEPTSVLTPQEADEVLGHVRDFARQGLCTVLIITHRFREVTAYADDVTVLRRGRAVHHARVAETDPARLAQAMVGGSADSEAAREAAGEATEAHAPVAADAPVALEVQGLNAMGDRGTLAVRELSLAVKAGEILGVAGVSGNGQRELVEALVGQRPRAGGQVRVLGEPYAAKRGENHRLGLRSLPEEPLRSACVGDLSVAENMALRDFDRAPLCAGGRLRFGRWRSRAREWIAEYGIKTRGEDAPIRSLSGGNVQRAVLARELAGDVRVLIAANPVFGLDFAAVAEIHARIRQVRARGGAVLLISEDLDELLELADRIVVMSEGHVVFETPAAQAERHVLGAHMGGGHHEAPVAAGAPA